MADLFHQPKKLFNELFIGKKSKRPLVVFPQKRFFPAVVLFSENYGDENWATYGSLGEAHTAHMLLDKTNTQSQSHDQVY